MKDLTSINIPKQMLVTTQQLEELQTLVEEFEETEKKEYEGRQGKYS